MIRRLGLTAVLVLGLGSAVPADVQYGIDVEQETLRFMLGQHHMATNLELGRKQPPDYPAAAAFYRKAAVLGYPLAQARLGLLYEIGRGVPQDHVLAYLWYAMAASRGDDHAAQSRDALTQRLTQPEVLAAQALVRQLQPLLP